MKRDLRWHIPKKKTPRDRVNRYWPNVAYSGGNVTGLRENTRTMNRGLLHVAHKIRICDALRNMRIWVSDASVEMKIDDVTAYSDFFKSTCTETLQDLGNWNGNEGKAVIRAIFHTGPYTFRDEDLYSTYETTNHDYNFYTGLMVTVRRVKGRYTATVFLFKINSVWCDKSSHGWYVSNEFDRPLVGDPAKGMRLGEAI